MELKRIFEERIRKYYTLPEIVNREVRWFGHVVRAKGTLVNSSCMVKLREKITRKTVVGRCKGMDRAELE